MVLCSESIVADPDTDRNGCRDQFVGRMLFREVTSLVS